MIQIAHIDMKGFTFKGSCNCDGSLTEKWQWGEYQFKIKATRFKIKKGGITVKGWTPLAQLQTAINDVAVQKA